MIMLSAVGIYHFEHQAQPEVYRSLFDALWWAVITLTTVGYGDTYPITIAGRLFTFVILMIGLGLIAVPTGIDRKSTRLNSSHVRISYAVFCLKKKNVKRFLRSFPLLSALDMPR